MQNGLSVDVEDWFQVGAFERIDRSRRLAGARMPGRGELRCGFAPVRRGRGFGHILHARLGRYPALIRRIVDAGHELASHGYDHKRVFQMTAGEFAADLEKTRAILEKSMASPCAAIAHPAFRSMRARLGACCPCRTGIGAYSSSVAPVVHDHYGWAQSPRHAWQPLPRQRADRMAGDAPRASRAGRLPRGGGGFHATASYPRAGRGMNREGHPAILYFHPWEIDPGQPRVADAPLRSASGIIPASPRWRGKLKKLLDDF